MFILKQFHIIITILGAERLCLCLWGWTPLAPAVLCGNLVVTCTQDRRLWIWIYPWISTLKSVDMDMDMDGKFHIHGKPGQMRGRSVGPQYILLLTLISYTPLRYVMNVACKE